MRWKTYTRKSFDKAAAGFERDGFKIIEKIEKFNRTGIVAEHKTAFNYDTKKKKRAYYLEGTSYQMGYLMGLMAEKEISRMTNDFIRKVIPDFVNSGSQRGIIEDSLLSLVDGLFKDTFNELPYEIREELHGIHEGCKEADPETRVDMKRLYVLNSGIDILCSIVYSGDLLFKSRKGLKPQNFKVPILCNGFSVFGSSAGRGHYFGRDFMFPTAGVFQDVAAHIIYNPVVERNIKPLPFISVTAPGMAGSISGMNIRGVASGVDMSVAGNCNPAKVGTNSILLTRMVSQFGSSAAKAVDIIEKTKRGVSWNYIVADGYNDRACIVEASSTSDKLELMEFASKDYLKYLPDMDFIDKHKSAKFRNGLMVRWNDYRYPVEYLKYNKGLLEFYNKQSGFNKTFSDSAFGEKGYINKSWDGKNCPSAFYFAPQRENYNNLVLTTNHFIIPEMRYYSMHPWASKVVGNRINDIQWRYDELNNQMISTIEKEGYINYDSAKRLIDYLAPYGKYPGYYGKNPRSSDFRELKIKGCVSLFDLKKKSVESHYGYYCDDWVKMSLPYYV